ncbi:MAG: PspC domain-containing protein, partial [Pedobacter sp.]
MKKTLNINIGNSIIHIEEDAYEILTAYLNEVKSHFSGSADDFEIVTDIENRVAEMFSEILLKEQRQAVVMADVQLIIAQMGSVKDFEQEDAEVSDVIQPVNEGVKKLYRDTDHAVIAGVCSGLGHYLHIDERWIRVFMLLTILLGGSGILAYIVMWIIIPRAVTRSEKMYMRGEAVNLQGFFKNFEEEMAANQLMKRSGGLVKEVVFALDRLVGALGKTIVKIIAVIIMIMGSCFLISLFVMVAVLLGAWDANPYEFFPLNIVSASYLTEVIFAFFVTLSIPLLALILFSIRVAFNSRAINKTVSYGLLIIWLAGVMSSIFYVAKITSEFKEEAEFTQVRTLVKYPLYNVRVDRTMFFNHEDSVRYNITAESYAGKVIISDDRGAFATPSRVGLQIEKSDNGKVTLTQNY